MIERIVFLLRREIYANVPHGAPPALDVFEYAPLRRAISTDKTVERRACSNYGTRAERGAGTVKLGKHCSVAVPSAAYKNVAEDNGRETFVLRIFSCANVTSVGLYHVSVLAAVL